jgi:hypothetical protein
MGRVGSCVVSATTQTPASGPRGPVTTAPDIVCVDCYGSLGDLGGAKQPRHPHDLASGAIR